MGAGDYLILAVVGVWFIAAIYSIVRKKGGCSCGSCTGCSGRKKSDTGSCCCGQKGNKVAETNGEKEKTKTETVR